MTQFSLTHLFSVYQPSLLSTSESIQHLALSSLQEHLSQLLQDDPTNPALISFQSALTSPFSAASAISKGFSLSEVIEISHEALKIPISLDSNKLIIGCSQYSDFHLSISTTFSVEYILLKGIALQEFPNINPECRYLETNTRVFKHQIFEIPGTQVKVINASSEKLHVFINNKELICEGSPRILCNHDDFSITAMLNENSWYFQGVFYKYLHTIDSSQNSDYSPKLLIPISSLASKFYILTKQEEFSISFLIDPALAFMR